MRQPLPGPIAKVFGFAKRRPLLAKRDAMRLLPAILAAVGLALAGCASSPSTPGRPPSAALPASWPAAPTSEVAVHALGLVGTPYRWGGNTPAGGFDCSGLIGYVYRSDAGIALPRTVAQLARAGQRMEATELRGGDLVLFGALGNPTHAGIYVGGGRFVHAPSSGGTVRLDHLNSPHWMRQFIEFRRP